MKKGRRWLYGVVPWVWIGWGPVSFAYQAIPVSNQELAQDAVAIFNGTCIAKTEIELSLQESDEKRPAISYQFQILEAIKGTPGPEFRLLQFSPSFYQSVAPYFPVIQFEVGKEYLLFLGEPNRWGVKPILGGSQGFFKIRAAEKGTKTQATSGKMVQSSRGETKAYEEFAAEIKKYIK